MQGHNMTVLEADGHFAEPFIARPEYLPRGTYVVVVKTEKDPSKIYWVAFNVIGGKPATPTHLAISNYDPNYNHKPPTSTPPAVRFWSLWSNFSHRMVMMSKAVGGTFLSKLMNIHSNGRTVSGIHIQEILIIRVVRMIAILEASPSFSIWSNYQGCKNDSNSLLGFVEVNRRGKCTSKRLLTFSLSCCPCEETKHQISAKIAQLSVPNTKVKQRNAHTLYPVISWFSSQDVQFGGSNSYLNTENKDCGGKLS
ncbi:hypothetical protein C5167_008559 [Papaver somniferum]|uniref:Plastocyanin-like domain-containing protein n=1 Tax=Papaver somniferum TaxID=3469 RepID=A0A4Y7JVY6_PAPSO|nr:hypothetical protein C5167_008559 [Papaver somniferum]